MPHGDVHDSTLRGRHKFRPDNIFHGCTGDRMVKRYPSVGRVVTAQASVLMGLPLCWVLMRVLPERLGPHAAYWAFAATFGTMGMFITWCVASQGGCACLPGLHDHRHPAL